MWIWGWGMQIFSQSQKCSLVLESLPIFFCVPSCFCSEWQWAQEVPASVMCCLECTLLVTYCGWSDFSAWVVSSSPASSTRSQLWFICLWVSAELCSGKGGWSRNVLETVPFTLIWSSKESQILAAVQCQNLGRGAEVGLIIAKRDSNWSPSILITG